MTSELRIAHIVNPVLVPASSDLHTAQPVTFESMRRARAFAAADGVAAELCFTCYEEDLAAAPDGFEQARLLDRSVLDCGEFVMQRKLPLIGDILERLYQLSEADYLVYSNVDIAVMPHFYSGIAALLAQGHDAFVINRRTISGHYRSVAELPLMYAESGAPHPGYDCFVFRRSLFERFVLGNTCLGINWVGTVLLWNLQVFARDFRAFTDLHMTFHIGNDKAWKNPAFADYVAHNKREAAAVCGRLQAGTSAPVVLKHAEQLEA